MKIVCLVLLCFTVALSAHPIPDIPVRSNLEKDTLKVQIELDLRCLDQDPEGAPYLLNKDLLKWGDISVNTAKQLAEKYVSERLQFNFNGEKMSVPKFNFRFMKLGGGDLELGKDVVVLALEFEKQGIVNNQLFSVKSLLNNELAIEVEYAVNGKTIPRKATLFPGEKSYDWSLRPQ